MTPWTSVAGLAALAGQADLFLVDQFGTLHDGTRAYPGALDGLACLREAGARVVLLSNSGRRTAPNRDRLARLGFPPESYDLFVSSGEIAWRHLARTTPPGAGRRCLFLSRRDDRGFFDGLGWQATSDAAMADLVLIAGSDADRLSLDDYAALLRPAAARRLPCLCANPDRITLADGDFAPGAGRIAELYAALGGDVTWIGKPHGLIYQALFEELGIAPGPRVMAIGDSIEHDIAGAHAAGCRAALVTTGIAAGQSDAMLKAEAAERGAAPDFILTRFAR